MLNHRNAGRAQRRTRPRVARRYRTCAEALQAAAELEGLAEDEVSELRRQGQEAKADRRADAWNREIARALGEAEALRRALNGADGPPTAVTSPRTHRSKGARYAGLWKQSPPGALAVSGLALFALVEIARLIDRLAAELLALAGLALVLAFIARSTSPKRRRGRRAR